MLCTSQISANLLPKPPPMMMRTLSSDVSVLDTAASMAPVPEAVRKATLDASSAPRSLLRTASESSIMAENSAVLKYGSCLPDSSRVSGYIITGPTVKSLIVSSETGLLSRWQINNLLRKIPSASVLSALYFQHYRWMHIQPQNLINVV